MGTEKHNKRLTIHESSDIARYIRKLRATAQKTKTRLLELVPAQDCISLLYQMKFCKVGCDPLDLDRPLNLIEQLNQTFTYAASLKAAEYLFDRHRDVRSLTLNLGTRFGWDIETDDDGGIVAEVFASVSPKNNDKLKEDIAKVAGAQARYRYVFFMCPNVEPGPQQHDFQPVSVQVVSLGFNWIEP